MLDALMLLLTAACFLGAWAYTRACERL